MRRLTCVSVCVWSWFVAASLLAQAPPARTIWDGSYTTEQADRGRTMYAADCAGCHGGSLQGGQAKALTGTAFLDKWREQSVGDLLTYVSKNMPLEAPGTLSSAVYLDIVSHILRSNELPAGSQELTAASSSSIRIVAKDGSGELPASTLARVIGCLAPREANGDWRIIKATRPERASSAGSAAPADAALGDREYVLKFVLTPLTAMVGHRVAVTGLLLGDGGKDGVNVSTVRSVAPACN